MISLGKLGGKELNYSSDIDLMFVYSGNGETDGPEPITNKEFFKKVANQYTELLSTYTRRECATGWTCGCGRTARFGEVCISLDGARRLLPDAGARLGTADADQGAYGGGRARTGRRAAGVRGAADLLEFAGFPRGGSGVGNTRAHQRKTGGATRAAQRPGIKLARGGIRDIEFLVQCLQRLHGGREPWVRHGGTCRLCSVCAIRACSPRRSTPGWLPHISSCATWNTACSSTRTCRPIRCRTDPEELDVLARKMPHETAGMALTGKTLRGRLDEHLEAVREIYERVIHGKRPLTYAAPPAPPKTLPLNAPAAPGATRSGRRDSLPRPCRRPWPLPIFPAAASGSRIFWTR